MRIFGFEIALTRAVPANAVAVGDRGNWWWPVGPREPFTGAWQKSDRFAYHATRARGETLYSTPVYACVRLISSDIAKLRVKLVQEKDDGTEVEVVSPAFSRLLDKPNPWQSRINFYQQWLTSKLIHGNTYVLKEYDNRNVVAAMYVLDPTRVCPLVTDDGDVYYQLNRDTLSGLTDESIVVPASQIMHDVHAPSFHPLVGISPLISGGGPALQGLAIQALSSTLFRNGATPGGILTAPGVIDRPTADKIKERWEENFTGNNIGRVAILGNGLEYKATGWSAVDTQLVEQTRETALAVCAAFGVPPDIVGIHTGDTSSSRQMNVQATMVRYYTQCLQIYIESIEYLLNQGLGLDGAGYGAEFDLDQLFRMDSQTLNQTLAEAVKAGFMAPDEARARIGLGPTTGGSQPYLQEQNWPLSILASRPMNSRPPTAPSNTDPPAPSEPPPPRAAPEFDRELLHEEALRQYRALAA